MSAGARPLPSPDPDSGRFWDACAEHRLIAQRCGDCDAWRWPPAAYCPRCHRRGGTWHELPGTGRVESFVIVERAAGAAFAAELPLVVATVRLDGADGVVLRSNVVGCRPDDVVVGMAVEVTFRHLSDAVALPLFEPV
jgi:uncharacterized OB-fold protein